MASPTSISCRSRGGVTTAPPGWFQDQLGLSYSGLLRACRENFVYNAGGGEVFRRLTSTFLSPLATGYLLVVALFHVPLRRRFGPPLALLLFAALLWTHTRAAVARARLSACWLSRCCAGGRGRSCWPSLVAVVGFAFVKEYTHFGPRTHFTATELHDAGAARQDRRPRLERRDECERRLDERAPREPARRDPHRVPPPVGLRPRQRRGHRVADARARCGPASRPTPSSASRPGSLGGLLFAAWSLALLRRLAWLPWLAATFAVVLALGLQTDVIGIPWLAVGRRGRCARRRVARARIERGHRIPSQRPRAD